MCKKNSNFAADLFWNSMQKRFFIAFICLTTCLLAFADEVRYITTSQFRERIFDYKTERDWKYKGDKPCIIDFYTTWCGPCKLLAPIMEELSQTYCDQIVFYKADTDRERELAYVFGINSIPQVLYVPMKGKPMLIKGYYPKDEIVTIINEFLLTAPVEESSAVSNQASEEQKEEKKSLWERWKEKLKYRKNKK